MSSAYENAMNDQQANNYTQQYPVSKLCAHILCSNGALFGGYCSDHQSERAEAAEARAAQLEIDNDEKQSYINEIRVALHTEKDELTIDAVRRVISDRDEARYKIGLMTEYEITQKQLLIKTTAERDEWKATAENQHAHLELARKDFMRRLRVVTHLWFGAKSERDAAQRTIEALQSQVWRLEAQEHNRDDGNEWDKEYYLRGMHR